MPLSYPTYENLIATGRAVIRRALPAVDPTVFGSFTRAFVDSCASLAYTVLLKVRDLEIQLFPQTATGEFLERWAGYEGLERNPASSAFGFVSHTGTVGTVIPVGTRYRSSNGDFFASQAVASIQTVAQSISSVTRTGSTATVTTAADHTLATGLEVTISGANESAYNGTFEITVTARNQFEYTVSGNPATPATGTISLASDYASVEIEAEGVGQATNVDSAGILTLVTAISGADATATAQFDGLSGGAEIEGDEALRARVLLSRRTLEGVFTNDQIKLAALGINGNTRVFIVNPTDSTCDVTTGTVGGTLSPGQVAVYVLRDNDANIIPTATVLAATKTAIIQNGRLPAHTSESDVFVFAPTPVATDFTFTSILPNTPTMQTAVRNSLIAFFEDTVDFEQDVTEASYLGAIQNTQDAQTGEFLQSFALSAPSGNITAADGEIIVLGTVSF